MKKYDFTNKAIKCDEGAWWQMERLAEIAREQNWKQEDFNEGEFKNSHCVYFGVDDVDFTFTNFSILDISGHETVISYSDFIASGVEDSNGSEDKKLEDEAAKYEDATPHNGLGSAIFKAGASWQKQQQGWSDDDSRRLWNTAFLEGVNKATHENYQVTPFEEYLSNYKQQKLSK